MNIDLYNYDGDNRVVHKDPGTVIVEMHNGTLRNDCDLIDPIILVHSDPRNCNYAHIPEFNRWYFITDIEVIRTGLWQITFHVDVLKTYEDDILECDIIVDKCSARAVDAFGQDGIGFNSMLEDNTIPIEQSTRHRAFQLDKGSTYHFSWSKNLILVTAG